MNFPIRLVANDDPTYNKENLVKNKFLLDENMKCLKVGLFSVGQSDPIEQLYEILKNKDFGYEFPTSTLTNVNTVEFKT